MHHSPFPPVLALALALLASSSIAALAQDGVEEDWVEHDSAMVARLVGIVRDHPERILELDVFRRTEFDDLGFGYSYHETFTEGSYVATKLQIVLKGGVPVAFAITPRLPYPYTELYDRYRAFYSAPFEFDSTGTPRTYYWNYRDMTMPVGDSSYVLRFQRQVFKHPLRERIEHLMTPFSGVEYGCGTRASNTMPSNRQLFEEIAPAMSYLLATCMLRSINPAVRLTAVEYLQRFHPDKYRKAPMQRDVKKILRSYPKAITIVGFERTHVSSESIVARLVKEECMSGPPASEVAEEKPRRGRAPRPRMPVEEPEEESAVGVEKP